MTMETRGSSGTDAGRAPASFARDPNDWLRRYSPKEWIRAAMKELRLAETSYAQRNARAGLAGCKRAAGMALNAALIVEPNDAWKRTYIEHLRALAEDETVPAAVSAAARTLLDMPAPGGEIVILRSPGQNEKVLEAARDVMAHAFAVVMRHEKSA
jgi:HEPN domain-containing protein